MKEPINTHPMQQQPTAVRKASMMAGPSLLGGYRCNRFAKPFPKPSVLGFQLSDAFKQSCTFCYEFLIPL